MLFNLPIFPPRLTGILVILAAEQAQHLGSFSRLELLLLPQLTLIALFRFVSSFPQLPALFFVL